MSAQDESDGAGERHAQAGNVLFLQQRIDLPSGQNQRTT